MLLYMSLSGGFLIALTLLFRALLQNRVDRRVWLILWALAALRLLVPVSVASPTSIFNLPIFRQTQDAAQVTVAPQTVPQSLPSAPQPVPAAAPGLSLQQVLLGVWLLGIAVLLTVILAAHLKDRRQYRKAMPISSPEGVPSRVRVRVLDGVGAPLTYGVFRPVILLPSDLSGEPAPLRRVLAHELSHIRCMDVLYKTVLLAAAVIHWFNPLAWVMFFVAAQDTELRADADAVRVLGEKRAYAETLVAAEERKLRGILQASFSPNSTEQRIRALKKSKPNKALSVIAALLLPVLLLAVFATVQLPAAASQQMLPQQTETIETSESPETAEPAAVETLPPQTEETASSVPETETETEPAQAAPEFPYSPAWKGATSYTSRASAMIR